MGHHVPTGRKVYNNNKSAAHAHMALRMRCGKTWHSGCAVHVLVAGRIEDKHSSAAKR